MFPSQRRALFDRLSKTSIGDYVANATKLGVADIMNQFLPPSFFKENFRKICGKMEELSLQELDNIEQFPDAIVSLHMLFIFSFFYLDQIKECVK